MSASYSGGIGITLISDTSATKVTASEKLEVKTYMNHTGGFGGMATFDPTGEISVEGVGTSSVAVGSSITGPSGMSSGKVIVDSVETTQKNDDFNGFKYTAKIFPSAS